MDNCFVSGNQNSGGATTENSGSWSVEENVAYTIFIDINKKSMTSKKKMREMQFYDKLAAFVVTRTCSQCRSHHQKLFHKYKNLTTIRQVFKTQIGLLEYKKRLKEGFERMEVINRSFELNQPIIPLQASSQHRQAEELAQQVPVEAARSSLIPLNQISYNYNVNPPTMMMMGPFGWFLMTPELNSFMPYNFIS